MIILKSTEQWEIHSKEVHTITRDVTDRHKRVVQDLKQLATAYNTFSPTGALTLPILHPDDQTSGIFPTKNPIGIQVVIGGVVQMTIDKNGVRNGP